MSVKCQSRVGSGQPRVSVSQPCAVTGARAGSESEAWVVVTDTFTAGPIHAELVTILVNFV